MYFFFWGLWKAYSHFTHASAPLLIPSLNGNVACNHTIHNSLWTNYLINSWWHFFVKQQQNQHKSILSFVDECPNIEAQACEQIFQHISVKALDIFIDPVRMWHSIGACSKSKQNGAITRFSSFEMKHRNNKHIHKTKIKSREDKKNTKSKLQCRTLLILLCEGNSKRQAVVNMFLYMLMSLQLLYVCAAIDCWSFAGVVYSPLLLLFPAVVIKVRRCSKPNANALPLSASKTMLKHSTWQTKTKQRTCNNNTAVLAIKEMQQQSICMFFALIACYFCSRCPSLSIGNWGMAEKSMKSMQLNFEFVINHHFRSRMIKSAGHN